jgi:pyruvate/2-oxoglutarate/acetoin dehydrogenase E1 component/TPP-dependent pyruvate/acetoin dehydrogenase alpha subunit
MIEKMPSQTNRELNFDEFKQEILHDYKIAHISRQMSVLARKEVLNGHAKFGIFGDGKEVAQIAMAKQFRDGDWRSGYYRDQTFMLATGLTTPKIFFAQLYGETNTELNPDNSGRSFNNHYGTQLIDENDNWLVQTKHKNSSSDISPTAGQMPRLLGLALASKIYRNSPNLHHLTQFSHMGDEVAFGTIGDASTSEGHFFETMNAAAVLQIPMAISVWDDGFGISVPKKMQTVHASISKALKGFEKGSKDKRGMLIFQAKGWDYPALCQMYEQGIARCRREHVPVLFHVEDLTQPTGHSTSGSHERYKTEDRLKFEKEYDCLIKMRQWIIEIGLALEEELDNIEESAFHEVRHAQKEAFKEYMVPLEKERDSLIELVRAKKCVCSTGQQVKIDEDVDHLQTVVTLNRREILSTARKLLRHFCALCQSDNSLKNDLQKWVADYREQTHQMYSAWLYSESPSSALNIPPVAPFYEDEAPMVPGREIIRDNYDALLAKDPRVLIFGEDIGLLGGVNQTCEGLQLKYSKWRVSDTGIRETSIVGKGIGLALRGLRPIVEIQYFDYLLYALQTLSDDVATTRYRTKNRQQVPLIISTRGHRLEGIWHSGSPMSMVINAIRGIYVCVPRDMTRAAGFYNTLIKGTDPALVIEPLNGYRIREKRPSNMGEYSIPLGQPEVLHHGTDVTLVTYGSCVRIAQEAVEQLTEVGISVELIDVQTLLPFDLNQSILTSIKKTNKVVFFDEDVPGGATAYMMQKVVEEQGAFFYLDAQPVTVTAKEHRPAYGTDGDYFSNPNAEDVYEAVYGLLSDLNPEKFPPIYS